MKFSPNCTVHNILSGDHNRGCQKGHKDSRKMLDGWPNLLARDSWGTVYIYSNMVSFTTELKSALKIIFCFLLPGTIKNSQAVDEISFLPRGRKIISEI